MIARKKKWPAQNLEELICFLEDQYPEGNIPLEDVSRRLGESRASVSSMFCKDDMKLSKAEKIVSCYGHRLRLFFPVNDEEKTDEAEPSQKRYRAAGNLKGMADCMNDSGETFYSLAKRMKMTRDVLSNAFRKGDMRISTLYAVIDALGKYVIWKFDKIQ